MAVVIAGIVAFAIVAALAIVLLAATQLSGRDAAAERSEDDN